MKNIILAFALLILTLCATSEVSIRNVAHAAAQNETRMETAGQTLSKIAGLPLPLSALHGSDVARSNIPLGANMVSAARSVQYVEGGHFIVSKAPSVLAKEASLGGFGPIPSSAALGLLIVALLLLPFMGRVELH